MFCMYCRQEWTQDHMNPFSEQACCLFKIGAGQTSKDPNADKTPIFTQKRRGTCTVTSMLLSLLAWLIVAPFGLLVFLPYLGYKKLLKKQVSTTQGSYLIALDPQTANNL